MKKSANASLLGLLRARRGLSKHRLSKLSGVTEATIRRLEGQTGTHHSSTWVKVLETMAPLGQINQEEMQAIAAETGLSAEAVSAINRHARASELKSDALPSPQARMLAVMRDHPEHADRFADLLEAAARLIGPT